jgi:hypothetical protein
VATIMRLAASPSRIGGMKVMSYLEGTASLAWDASPEKGVTMYVVTVTPPDSAPRTITVNSPRATLQNAAEGTEVSVKAVNERGLESWDAARVTIRK